MTEPRSRITEHYREMLSQGRPKPDLSDCKSECERQIRQMDPGARSSLEFTQGSYQTGGNEGESYEEKAREQRKDERSATP